MKILSVTLHGFREWQYTLASGRGRMNTMGRILDQIADDMMEAIASTIHSQGRRGGGSWPKLDPDTIRRKAGHEAIGGMLVDSGDLLAGYTQRGDEHQRLTVTNQTIKLGTDLDYPEVHQKGNEHVPRRQFINFTQGDRRKWTNRVQRELRKAVVGR